jgi:hypothetical protein
MSANLWQPEGAYDSLATITVPSGGVSSITFTGIPSTYKHLQLRTLARTNRSGANQDPLKFIFNSDTASNYSNHFLYGDGSSASAFADTPISFVAAYMASAATASSNVFGTCVIDLLDYSNTNKFKTLRSLGGIDNNGNGAISLTSGFWRSTSAITSIAISPQVGTSFDQYSSFALYGCK